VEGSGCVLSVQVAASQRAILGMSDGHIRIYSLKTEGRGKLLLSIELGSAAICSLLWQAERQTLLVYSRDGQLSLVSLQSMGAEQQYLAGSYSPAVFLSEGLLLGLGSKSSSIYNTDSPHFGKSLAVIELSLQAEKVAELKAGVGGSCRSGETHLLQLSDNALLVLLGDGEHEVRSYLPPKCVSVRSMSRNIFTEEEEYWLLTNRSEVYKYQVGPEGVSVKGVVQLGVFRDKHQKTHN
jgi:hypothetical protein